MDGGQLISEARLRLARLFQPADAQQLVSAVCHYALEAAEVVRGVGTPEQRSEAVADCGGAALFALQRLGSSNGKELLAEAGELLSSESSPARWIDEDSDQEFGTQVAFSVKAALFVAATEPIAQAGTVRHQMVTLLALTLDYLEAGGETRV